ncbi:aromatic ring-hydroxylating dioxygenase subunit alpha [Erythrobacter westpacificensis]|uniref:Aromatic ring-hydroxylating dioxygenase subunit alpha n=1 Tax=Erythrobacter westpacificensis TaxID=1055231 RepID=A0ABP9KNL9_9SPHN
MEQPFLENIWYMAAWSHEVGETMLHRRLLGEPVLLMRKTDGAAIAMIDRCPHRFAPLSQGERDGDCVTCPYHGLTFDSSGQCVRNPFSETIPTGAGVKTFPVAERNRIVWFWPGDPELADESAVPDFSAIVVDGHAPITGVMPMDANYEYGTDNLMDLSHIEFVHKGTFAGRGVIFAGEHELKVEGEQLHSNWWMPDIPAPAHTFGIYAPDMITDHWLDMRWNAPASMYLQVGACPAGGERDDGVIAHQAHILTPETEHSTHYFWATTRQGPPSEEGDAMIAGLMGQAFGDEDKPIIEAAFANTEGADFWDRKPVSLGIDQGGTRARRIIEKLKKDEAAQ